MANETREFEKRILLSITSGVNLADDFGQVSSAINFLADDHVSTHQLVDVAERLTPKLLEDFPELDMEVEAMSLDQREEFEAEHDLDKTFEVSPYNVEVGDALKTLQEKTGARMTKPITIVDDADITD